ncbi:menaquinone-dependent protoporphyrinogen IX dehydrogenase [Thiomicrorhabdus sp. 6S3-12]|uniref:menaquinone-dependent protoporphyrinogen IX dehydrogenase n=1 Tax=Thiomicrorhabdus sp. 6S3-12 TaxID=2819681 RepID=UPI001AACE86C|nr:menaquinone-dependent protoporphyrinogen IX dehydrogenase [Thiomicrorhabdus sp. 6S3-12]MBO1924711.1 menaquinone-dependent protoporphyrinogen IX dehydrogenase [Thiomicrorhabdus sp. 6S3-12]
MSEILIVYSTVDGHTKKICERLRKTLEHDDNQVSTVSLEQAIQMDLEPFDKLVLGASIRYGKYRPAVLHFIEQNLELLNRKASAFFSVNVVARKTEKNRPETNPYFKKLFKQTDWKPAKADVFAGRIDYPNYTFLDRQMIRLIMKLTHGPTDTAASFEFTDWDRVEHFGKAIDRLQTD